MPVDISFGSSIKQENPIHKTSFCYQRADWDLFRDFHRNITWCEILSFSIENCATEVSSRVKAGIDAISEIPNETTIFSLAHTCLFCRMNYF